MYGGVAQLGEHLLCTQGVRGSNPLISTFVSRYFIMGNVFYQIFISKFILKKKEEGVSVSAAKAELLDVLKKLQALQPKDKELIGNHISLIESLGDFSSVKKYSSSYSPDEVEEGKIGSAKYIVFFQGDVSKKVKDIKSIAFGPFTENIASWKMNLLKKRVAKIERSLLYRSESVVVCSRDSKTFHFKSASKRSKVPTFGFIMFDEASMPEDKNIEYKSSFDLRRWDSFLEDNMKRHWDLDSISDHIGSFLAYH